MNNVFGQNILFYDVIDSTNLEAKRKALEGAHHGTLIIADAQSAGKGRLGRTWSSPAGMGVWMSLLLRPSFAPAMAPKLTLLAAMAVVDVLESMGIECSIKWPNDIVIGGKKVCGILTEMGTDGDFIAYVVVGIGINVYNTSFPEDIDSVAASIYKAYPNADVNRESLIKDIVNRFEYYYDIFIIEENLSFIRAAYNKHLAHRNMDVFIIEDEKKRQGKCLGIDEQGALMVEFEHGIETVVAGEISVRGIYGYV